MKYYMKINYQVGSFVNLLLVWLKAHCATNVSNKFGSYLGHELTYILTQVDYYNIVIVIF